MIDSEELPIWGLMINGILALLATFLLLPNTGLAKVNPAQTMEELEKQAGEPGNEDLSVLSNTVGLDPLRIGLEPYLPEINQAGLAAEDLYDRQPEPQSGTGTSSSSSSEDAAER